MNEDIENNLIWYESQFILVRLSLSERCKYIVSEQINNLRFIVSCSIFQPASSNFDFVHAFEFRLHQFEWLIEVHILDTIKKNLPFEK